MGRWGTGPLLPHFPGGETEVQRGQEEVAWDGAYICSRTVSLASGLGCQPRGATRNLLCGPFVRRALCRDLAPPSSSGDAQQAGQE